MSWCLAWGEGVGVSSVLPTSLWCLVQGACEVPCFCSQHTIFGFVFFLVLPVYCYQPISLHPHAHILSHVIPWTSAHQTPLSVDFSRQEYWSGLPFPSPPTHNFCSQLFRSGSWVFGLFSMFCPEFTPAAHARSCF